MQLEQAWNELVEATRDLEAHRALFASASKTFDEAQRSVYASEDRMYKACRTIEELAKAAAFPPDAKAAGFADDRPKRAIKDNPQA